jgi:hypothetical protein
MAVLVSKWNIILLDADKATIEILGCYDDYRDALYYMNENVDKHTEYNDVNLFRKIHDDINTISIYQTHWISQKTLICRYFVCHYYDC